jgi:hypothetical protein
LRCGLVSICLDNRPRFRQNVNPLKAHHQQRKLEDTATMSEQESAGTSAAEGTATAVAPVEESEPLFTDEEIKQFDADDTQVGGAIGKMLSVFFLYTVVAMSIVAWWTFNNSAN